MKKRTLNLLSLAGLAVFIVLATATTDTKKNNSEDSSNSTTTTTPKEEKPNYDFKLTAPELLAAYQENEVAADKKYKGKKILVTGVAESINKDILDQSYVTLTGDGYFSNIHCTMKSEDDAASIKKGKTYSFLGECSGLIIGSVMLDDCTIQ
jgi:hypothetical protein